MKNILILLFFLVAVSACNKENRFSKRLMKGETWNVTDLTVDGVNQGILGKWKITKDGSIYDSVQEAKWLVRKEIYKFNLGPLSQTLADKYWQPTGNFVDSLLSQFNWQFSNKGKIFKFKYKQLCEECDATYLSDTDKLAFNITGDYKVTEHKKGKMQFESTATRGFSGKKVVIKLEKTF